MEKYWINVQDLLVEYTPKVLTALAILIVGLFAIKFIVKASQKIMQKRGVDITLQKFLGDLTSWALKALLFVTVIAKLGVATTSFAAIIGAAGLAIGLALQGSLSNFAGGALIMIFKPFKIGDLIETQGVTGVVKEIQIFTTHLNTPGNKLAIIPNGTLSNGNIINYTAEGKLRVDLTIGVSYDTDIKQAKEVLLSALTSNPKVLKDPAPSVNVSELADSSVNFAVRPWATPAEYWDVYFESLENAKIALDKAGIEIPYPHSVEIQKKG
ncbi:mechanosensitive ion channel family protein [Tenacibaculum maritimum]|uniref:Small-conductance mechanosensitive channel n=2 Tax=Tenacibaculum maritimum TaxID=107401 RepID=A0A2H1E6H7_9FLAO|nr:mechanosensitive ion channel domain-containing protein [Tenacibaculum maritimum]MCD9561872.1 mechanosensitive ion channel [Tenacibaculum maritimum]MCD9565014.1 mechanosensitive ion channel [Tenacibaculum maritimum]MCD9578987.1 mechanosensitive ion channel [Tenacibaculum maritimum]MCD9584050.1 mechanosensitive ion channel [Tenacibaculum maritimum]MCD9595841.1 mechanosensitive ion channel [Tenacibaculum maritimum]